jgi:hypothetical protein
MFGGFEKYINREENKTMALKQSASKLDMRPTEEKYCVLPNQQPIRCASTDGHVIIIGYVPRTIPRMFKAEALRQNALTEYALENWMKGIGRDPEPEKEPELPPQSQNVEGLTAEQKYDRIKEKLMPILVAGEPQNFTQQGIPKVEALTAACGFDVTASERDAAFAELKDSPELKG